MQIYQIICNKAKAPVEQMFATSVSLTKVCNKRQLNNFFGRSAGFSSLVGRSTLQTEFGSLVKELTFSPSILTLKVTITVSCTVSWL